jgi:hypothetical protein
MDRNSLHWIVSTCGSTSVMVEDNLNRNPSSQLRGNPGIGLTENYRRWLLLERLPVRQLLATQSNTHYGNRNYCSDY